MAVSERLGVEQILAEPAGPRLNAWVAEALGWTREPFRGKPGYGMMWRIHDKEPCPEGYDRHEWDSWADDDEMAPGGDFDFSGGIKAAWWVVEAMKGRFHAVVKSPFDAGLPYFAGFTELGASGFNGRPDYYTEGDTAPLAICRAFLLAQLSKEPTP